MAATAPPLGSLEREGSSQALERSGSGVLAVSALTVLAFVMNGYHPYAEDGGLYLAGVKRVLDPGLYSYGAGFTTAQLHFSLFAPIVAWLVRATHLPLMAMMLLLQVASIWATLLAGWHLAIRMFEKAAARVGAVSLLALLMAVPVAGTSLMLMDPYVSARSISTPCGLFALVSMMDIASQARGPGRISWRSVLVCLGCLFVAMLVHPLMGVYGLECVLMQAIANLPGRRMQWVAYSGLWVLAVTGASMLVRLAPAPPPGYTEVAHTRSYWFISQWHWYELAGLAAPLLVLALVRFRKTDVSGGALKSLARMALVAGGLAVLIAMLFARWSMSSYAVAKLQPLRVFQAIYVITIVCVGGLLGETVLKRRAWRWAGMLGSTAVLMVMVQRIPFSHSAHIELPWLSPANGWEQAFAWVKNHTPKDDVVALDSDYITAAGEDAQNFRAIAERSAIPDYSKDGGIASISPDLTPDWIRGESAQKGLNGATDGERTARLRAFPVQWVVLPSHAVTGFRCEYANGLAKVCRMPAGAGGGKIIPSNAYVANETK